MEVVILIALLFVGILILGLSEGRPRGSGSNYSPEPKGKLRPDVPPPPPPFRLTGGRELGVPHNAGREPPPKPAVPGGVRKPK